MPNTARTNHVKWPIDDRCSALIHHAFFRWKELMMPCPTVTTVHPAALFTPNFPTSVKAAVPLSVPTVTNERPTLSPQ